MFLYRNGRVETLKQFCGVIPGDRATRGFLDPADVSYNYNLKKNVRKMVKVS